jgi:hypothetical protein
VTRSLIVERGEAFCRYRLQISASSGVDEIENNELSMAVLREIRLQEDLLFRQTGPLGELTRAAGVSDRRERRP